MAPTQDIRAKFGRFRILVVGRANAGKTTLLQRICNTTEKPEIFDREGNKVDLAFRAVSA
jgi:GTPase SAR1 family protein